MNNYKPGQRHHAASFLCLLANLVFYLAFPIADGPVWCKDSLSYTTMDVSREPLYPLFLKFFRDIFGDGSMPYGQPMYLFVAALVQSAIAAVVVWRVVLFFGSFESHVSHRKSTRGLLCLGTLAAFWGVQLLCRFAAQRGSAYPESIMTESLGMSLWLLFVMAAFRYFQKHQARYLFAAFLWMFLCISLRKQLLVCIIVFAGFAFIYELFVRRKWQAFLSVVCACLVSLSAATLADYGYNYAIRGVWMQHTGNAMGIDCTLLYTTTAEDAGLFGGGGAATAPSNIREVFLAIQSRMEEQDLRYVDVPSDASWEELAEHYALSYDVIGYEIMNPIVDAYVEAQNPAIAKGSPQYYQAVDAVEEELRDGLLHQNPARYCKVVWANFLEGLVNTVLRMSRPLIIASAVLYAMFLLLLIHLLRRDHGFLASDAACLLCWLILAGIGANSAVVGAVIFPQTRYMIYNMGLFYAGLWLLLVRTADKPGRR